MVVSNDFTRTPVILCIDVEPDDFFLDRNHPKPWTGFEFTHNYLKEFRARLEEVTGHKVHFYWSLRMDPQIAITYGSPAWLADHYSALLEEYQSQGDELGIHVHTYRWSDDLDGWVDDCGNPQWVSECLQSSAETFRRSIGRTSRSLRFGNFWLSTAAVNEAESLGIEYDLTVEPGLRSAQSAPGKPRQSGPTPDFLKVLRRPYAPSREDFRIPLPGDSRRKITIVPLSSSHTNPGFGLAGIRHRISRLVRNGLHGRLQSTPLSMWKKWDGNDTYTDMLSRAITVQKPPYLAFAIRTDLNGKTYSAYNASLQALLNHPACPGFVFSTPEEAMRHMQTVPTDNTKD